MPGRRKRPQNRARRTADVPHPSGLDTLARTRTTGGAGRQTAMGDERCVGEVEIDALMPYFKRITFVRSVFYWSKNGILATQLIDDVDIAAAG